MGWVLRGNKDVYLFSAFGEDTGLITAFHLLFDLRVSLTFDYSSYNELMSMFFKSYNSDFSISY